MSICQGSRLNTVAHSTPAPDCNPTASRASTGFYSSCWAPPELRMQPLSCIPCEARGQGQGCGRRGTVPPIEAIVTDIPLLSGCGADRSCSKAEVGMSSCGSGTSRPSPAQGADTPAAFKPVGRAALAVSPQQSPQHSPRLDPERCVAAPGRDQSLATYAGALVARSTATQGPCWPSATAALAHPIGTHEAVSGQQPAPAAYDVSPGTIENRAGAMAAMSQGAMRLFIRCGSDLGSTGITNLLYCCDSTRDSSSDASESRAAEMLAGWSLPLCARPHSGAHAADDMATAAAGDTCAGFSTGPSAHNEVQQLPESAVRRAQSDPGRRPQPSPTGAEVRHRGLPGLPWRVCSGADLLASPAGRPASHPPVPGGVCTGQVDPAGDLKRVSTCTADRDCRPSPGASAITTGQATILQPLTPPREGQGGAKYRGDVRDGSNTEAGAAAPESRSGRPGPAGFHSGLNQEEHGAEGPEAVQHAHGRAVRVLDVRGREDGGTDGEPSGNWRMSERSVRGWERDRNEEVSDGLADAAACEIGASRVAACQQDHGDGLDGVCEAARFGTIAPAMPLTPPAKPRRCGGWGSGGLHAPGSGSAAGSARAPMLARLLSSCLGRPPLG